VVRRLLQDHADEWCEDEEVAAFLRNTLRLPHAWLAQAQALWRRYCQDDAGGAAPRLGGGVKATRTDVASRSHSRSHLC
jgi:hypothetical protein